MLEKQPPDAVRTFRLPRDFSRLRNWLSSRVRIPIRIPEHGIFKVNNDKEPRYATASSFNPDSYEIEFHFGERCGFATVCSIGYISAGDKPYRGPYDYSFRLPQSSQAYIEETQCAASCSMGMIYWTEGKTYYSAGLKAGDKSSLIPWAESAVPRQRRSPRAANNFYSRFPVTFSIDEVPEHRVPMPKAALRQIQKLHSAVECMDEDKLDPTWFVVSEVALSGSHVGLVIRATNCLLGANVGPWWVFLKTESGFQLVLNSSALILTIADSTTRGMRDIHLSAVVATSEGITNIYRWNGAEYKIASQKRNSIN